MARWRRRVAALARSLADRVDEPATARGADVGVHVDATDAQLAGVRGMMSKAELHALLTLSASCDLPGDVLEVGSFLGLSTCHLAKGCAAVGHGVVHAVDTFQGNPGKEELYLRELTPPHRTILENFRANVKAAGVEHLVVPHVGSSRDAARDLPGPFRIVFIDGCHDYAAVREDIELWSPKLRSGGYLVCHDYSDGFPGSMRAIEECVLRAPAFRPAYLVGSLVVAQKR